MLFAFEISFCDPVFWGPESSSFIRQSAKIPVPVSSRRSWFMYSIPFMSATGGESDKNVVLFLEIVTSSCSSVTFLLVTVRVNALPADAQSRFAVAALLSVAMSNIYFVLRT